MITRVFSFYQCGGPGGAMALAERYLRHFPEARLDLGTIGDPTVRVWGLPRDSEDLRELDEQVFTGIWTREGGYE